MCWYRASHFFYVSASPPGLPVGGHHVECAFSNGGWHGLAGWGFRGFSETGAWLRADDGGNSLSAARSSVAAADLRLAELRYVSEFSGAEGFSVLLAAEARRSALCRHRGALQADQARRAARRRRRIPAALTGRVGKGAHAPCPPGFPEVEMVGLLTLSPPYQVQFVLTFSGITEREHVDGQKEADITSGAKDGREQDRRKTQRAQKTQDQGTRQGAQRASCQTAAAETAHRHQPLPRRGFRHQRSAHLREISRSGDRRGQPGSGAGACDPADRPVQS